MPRSVVREIAGPSYVGKSTDHAARLHGALAGAN
jgi:hypothetical protein